MARSLDEVRTIRLETPGRGRALREAWSWSQADVVAYMDIDLSTDLAAFVPLVTPLLSGESDIAVGTRLAPGASVVRGPRRELISRAYNLLLRSAGAAFTDAQCGFKALRAPVARELLPSSWTTPGSSTPNCCSRRSGAACGSTRSPCGGSRIPTAAWTCSGPRSPS